MHMPGTKLIEEGVDKNYGFSKCVQFVFYLLFIYLFLLLFFFHASMCMCRRKDALVGWVKSSRISAWEKRNMEEHGTAGLGPQRWPRTQEIMFTKKPFETWSISDASGPWWHKKKTKVRSTCLFYIRVSLWLMVFKTTSQRGQSREQRQLKIKMLSRFILLFYISQRAPFKKIPRGIT